MRIVEVVKESKPGLPGALSGTQIGVEHGFPMPEIGNFMTEQNVNHRNLLRIPCVYSRYEIRLRM